MWDHPKSSTCALLKIILYLKMSRTATERCGAVGAVATQQSCCCLPGRSRNLKICLPIFLFTVCFVGLWGFFVAPLPLDSLFHFIEEETCWGPEDASLALTCPAARVTSQADALLRAMYSHNSLFQEMSQEQQNPQTEAKHRALQFRQHNKSIDKVNLKSACFHNGKTNCRELGLQNTVL